MAKPYSLDLRERVVEAAGATRHAAGDRFGVSDSSAIRWVQGWMDTARYSRRQAVIPDEATRRRALELMRGRYHELYGEARGDAAREWLLNELQAMAERHAAAPHGWHDDGDASPAAKMSALLFLAMPDEERERLGAEVEEWLDLWLAGRRGQQQ